MSDLYVVGGNVDRYDKNTTDYIGALANLTIHERYLKNATDRNQNDLSILKVGAMGYFPLQINKFTPLQLLEPVPEGLPNFQPIDMISEDVMLLENITCTVAGWGRVVFDGRASRVLKMTQVTIMDNKRCFRSYKPRGNILCAGDYEGETDACRVSEQFNHSSSGY